MTVSSPVMVLIGLVMIYLTYKKKDRLKPTVFMVWMALYVVVTIAAALISLGVLHGL